MILPSKEIVDQAYVKDYEKLYKEVQEDPEAFWENIAHELSWFKPWDKVLEWNFPYARWFVGAQCNIVNNALDRHQKTATKDKLAYIWVGQDKSERKYTYGELNEQVCKFANVLKSLGIRKGDKVSIYLPRIPEQFIAMLACAKIGAVHSVVFSGFSSEALKNRILDAQAKLVITANAYPYKDKVLESKKTVDEAIKDIPTIEHVIVVKRIESEGKGKETSIGNEVGQSNNSNNLTSSPNRPPNPNLMTAVRDLWYHELMAKTDTICSTEIMEATDPLFILYTSGSTGKPKGVLHAHGGYMVGIYLTLKWIFNLQPDDIWFCTADAGWVTGHSYIVYSPLINGATTFVYEGTPDYPHPGIWWELIQKYKISKFYTAPTAVRAMMRLGDEIPNKYDLSSLKILGSVGEPINPEAWMWYYKTIGKERCPIMDTWWQTETGMQMITPLPSSPLKPGSANKPFFGVEADVVDDKGSPAAVNTQGFLVIKKPWPAMLRTIYGDHERYKQQYWSTFPGIYWTGDEARRDEDGYFWIMGRADDVIKVSGHRLGSSEIESALVSHPFVAESAVVGIPHELKGQGVVAFVTLVSGQAPSETLKDELKKHVVTQIGALARPEQIRFAKQLPKTRSGKIMRRLLRQIASEGKITGDTTTLEDISVVAALSQDEE
ncbi:acetate--CoA ligase [Candidatus Gottesmanbacteria bacterium]|nr:acetate--CoA ligase [Candidatus Gottesmanbacteria bacterium]